VSANLYRYLGEAFEAQNQWPEALAAAQKALLRAHQSHERIVAGESWYLLGRIGVASSLFITINDTHYSATSCLMQSLDIFTSLGDKSRATEVTQILSQLNSQREILA
jgi:tetratricopeptide (TPR) repeat protein